VVKSCSVDTALGCRSKLFGVKRPALAHSATIATAAHLAAQRRKYCAGVVATLHIVSAQSVRYLSMRALECSGPCLVAVREQTTSPLGCPHFYSQQEMN
jgi:hypothetical protein